MLTRNLFCATIVLAATTWTTGHAQIAPQSLPNHEAATIRTVSQEAIPDGVRVLIELDRKVPYEYGQTVKPARIFVDLKSTRAEGVQGKPIHADLVGLRHVRVAQHDPLNSRVTVDLDAQVPFSVSYQAKTSWIAIDLHRRFPSPANTTAGKRSPRTGLGPATSDDIRAADGRTSMLKSQQHPSIRREEVERIRRAAQSGDTQAQSNLGVLYANGWGVPRDMQEAVHWFRAAAEKGDSGGENNLGAMYLKGEGVRADAVEASKWLRRAALQGLPEAEYALGTLYANGRGVAQSDYQAVQWFSAAAAKHYAPAQAALERFLSAGWRTEVAK